MFLDCEGEPAQELSGIAMDNETYEIISVFHHHAACDPTLDNWSRRNIHGLNVKCLSDYGLENEECLAIAFQRWLKTFDVKCMYANDPCKERRLLKNDRIVDALLPRWEDRVNTPYHAVASRFKELCIPINNVRCTSFIHNARACSVSRHLNRTQTLKLLHGYHCSLYDSYELYLQYIFKTRYL